MRKLAEAGITEIPVLDIDHLTIGPYIRNTLALDRCQNREEALLDIYRVLRPGEPPTLDTAEALFGSLIFDSERYDLSPVGRVKMNMRLGWRARTRCACCAPRTSSPSSRCWSRSRTAAARSTTSIISATGACARSAS